MQDPKKITAGQVDDGRFRLWFRYLPPGGRTFSPMQYFPGPLWFRYLRTSAKSLLPPGGEG
jgi:hypothetical protein